MFKKLEKREAFRLTHSFILIGFDVYQALYEKRPASIARLVQASHRMMHYVIHADDQLRKKGGQWRMRRALAAAGASEVILRRLHSESEQRALITGAQEILERTVHAYRQEISDTAPAEETMTMPPRLLDLTYIEHVQTAEWLARLCYPVALSIEVKQPASALKLMEAVYDARRLLHELTGPHHSKRPERKLHKAVQAVKCVRAVLVRLSGEEPKEPARITAAVEVAERLLGMLQPSE